GMRGRGGRRRRANGGPSGKRSRGNCSGNVRSGEGAVAEKTRAERGFHLLSPTLRTGESFPEGLGFGGVGFLEGLGEVQHVEGEGLVLLAFVFVEGAFGEGLAEEREGELVQRLIELGEFLFREQVAVVQAGVDDGRVEPRAGL